MGGRSASCDGALPGSQDARRLSHGSEEWRALGNVEGHAVCARHGAGVAHQGGDDVVQVAIRRASRADRRFRPGRKGSLCQLHHSMRLIFLLTYLMNYGKIYAGKWTT